jgi:hypothetical protein
MDHGPPVSPDPAAEPAFGAWRASLLLAIVAAGIALLLLRPTVPGVPDGLLRLGAACLCVYGLLVVLAWFPLPWISRRIESMFEDLLGEGAGGWYLVVAVAYFALAEVDAALARLAASASIESLVRESVVSQLVGFSVDSFMNAVFASLWPMMLMRDHGTIPVAVLAGAVWALWWLGRLPFGEPRFDRRSAPGARPQG